MKIQIDDKIFEPFIPEAKILERVAEVANQITEDYRDRKPLIIGVLSGSFLFLADLVKQITLPTEISFVKIASYDGERSTGKLKVQLGLYSDLTDRHVIVVEDIVDTGHTLQFLLEMIYAEKPASVQVCSLLYKPAACGLSFKELSYIGFEIPNEFVLGYGLDYKGRGRNLRDIYRLAPN